MAADIGKTNSTLAGETLKWIARRCDVAHLEKYIAHPEAMPLLALPWWLEKSIRGEVDAEFQSTLMASSVHGYFFIRMLDDLMDGHEVEPASLPALHLFSFRFHSSYFRFFPASDPFWTHFERNLASTAEAVSSDHALKEISAKDFLEITSRKSSAALIPVAAVCCRYGREDLLPAWEQFLSLFARWHQMRDDVLDWSEDYEASHATWILGEAQHRKAPEETTAIWMGRTGLHWAAGVMDGWMAQIKASAAGLGSPELVRYLDAREAAFSRQMKANLRLAALCESLLKL